MATFKFRSARNAFFAVVVLLSLGGCVTSLDSERGRMFFDDERWDAFEENVAAELTKGRGVMTIEDVRKLVPKKPVGSSRSADIRRFVWYYSKSGNLALDFGVYGNTRGGEEGHFLLVDFTAGGILADFEIQSLQTPTGSSYFSSKPIIDEGVVYLHYTVLSNMLGKKMDDSLQKSKDSFMNDLKNFIKTDGATFVDKAKDAIGEMDTSSLPTDSADSGGGTPASTVQ